LQTSRSTAEVEVTTSSATPIFPEMKEKASIRDFGLKFEVGIIEAINNKMQGES